MTLAEKKRLDSLFWRMNATQQIAFIAKLEGIVATLQQQPAEERQAHCDRVASELLAEMQL